MKKVIIIAGDKSGDLYGGYLSKTLKEKFPNIEIYSFGGKCLGEHSKQITNLLSHSVSGIFEVFTSLKKLIDIFNFSYDEINRIQPDLVILIDFPDFNLRLAKKINKKYPVFYYISPQLWAWRENRIKQIKKYITKMIVIFKFEQFYYKNKGINVLYFGHPLLEIIKPANCERKKIISFLPGSRRNEIKRHLPIMRDVKQILEKDLECYSFRIIKAENIDDKIYQMLAPNIAIEPRCYKALEESEFIITSSGTATVEIAILGIPYLIIYKVNPLSWQILKRMVRTKYVGMVNILSQKKIIEELLQNDANPRIIASETLRCITNRKAHQKMQENLRNIKDILSPREAISSFANFIGQYLNL